MSFLNRTSVKEKIVINEQKKQEFKETLKAKKNFKPVLPIFPSIYDQVENHKDQTLFSSHKRIELPYNQSIIDETFNLISEDHPAPVFTSSFQSLQPFSSSQILSNNTLTQTSYYHNQDNKILNDYSNANNSTVNYSMNLNNTGSLSGLLNGKSLTNSFNSSLNVKSYDYVYAMASTTLPKLTDEDLVLARLGRKNITSYEMPLISYHPNNSQELTNDPNTKKIIFYREEYCGVCGIRHPNPEVMDTYSHCVMCFNVIREPSVLREKAKLSYQYATIYLRSYLKKRNLKDMFKLKKHHRTLLEGIKSADPSLIDINNLSKQNSIDNNQTINISEQNSLVSMTNQTKASENTNNASFANDMFDLTHWDYRSSFFHNVQKKRNQSKKVIGFADDETEIDLEPTFEEVDYDNSSLCTNEEASIYNKLPKNHRTIEIAKHMDDLTKKKYTSIIVDGINVNLINNNPTYLPLEILFATYGDPVDPLSVLVVTEKVQQLVNMSPLKDKLVFKPSMNFNSLFFPELFPNYSNFHKNRVRDFSNIAYYEAFNTFKPLQLRIRYRIHGVHATLVLDVHANYDDPRQKLYENQLKQIREYEAKHGLNNLDGINIEEKYINISKLINSINLPHHHVDENFVLSANAPSKRKVKLHLVAYGHPRATAMVSISNNLYSDLLISNEKKKNNVYEEYNQKMLEKDHPQLSNMKGKRVFEVTEVLRGLVDARGGDYLSVSTNININSLFGGDPSPGYTKDLKIFYQVEGKTGQVEVDVIRGRLANTIVFNSAPIISPIISIKRATYGITPTGKSRRLKKLRDLMNKIHAIEHKANSGMTLSFEESKFLSTKNNIINETNYLKNSKEVFFDVTDKVQLMVDARNMRFILKARPGGFSYSFTGVQSDNLSSSSHEENDSKSKNIEKIDEVMYPDINKIFGNPIPGALKFFEVVLECEQDHDDGEVTDSYEDLNFIKGDKKDYCIMVQDLENGRAELEESIEFYTELSLPPLIVNRAIFGELNDSRKCIDITASIQSFVNSYASINKTKFNQDQGKYNSGLASYRPQLSLPRGLDLQALCSYDPSPGRSKKLHLEFSTRGLKGIVKARIIHKEHTDFQPKSDTLKKNPLAPPARYSLSGTYLAANLEIGYPQLPHHYQYDGDPYCIILS